MMRKTLRLCLASALALATVAIAFADEQNQAVVSLSNTTTSILSQPLEADEPDAAKIEMVETDLDATDVEPETSYVSPIEVRQDERPDSVDEELETSDPLDLIPTPSNVSTIVFKRLLSFPSVLENTEVSKVVFINGEYCVAGDMYVLCYNESDDTFNTWNDIDPTPFFGGEISDCSTVVSETSCCSDEINGCLFHSFTEIAMSGEILPEASLALEAVSSSDGWEHGSVPFSREFGACLRSRLYEYCFEYISKKILVFDWMRSPEGPVEIFNPRELDAEHFRW